MKSLRIGRQYKFFNLSVPVPNAIQKPEAFSPSYEVTLSHSLTVPKAVRGQDDTAERELDQESYLDSVTLCYQPDNVNLKRSLKLDLTSKT